MNKRKCVTCQFFVPDDVDSNEKARQAARVSGVCFYDRPVMHPVHTVNPMTQQEMSGMMQARVKISDAQREFCAQHLDVVGLSVNDQMRMIREAVMALVPLPPGTH